jgi:hypothetical protein
MSDLLGQINATDSMKKMSSEKTFYMRSFLFASCCLAMLLTVSSCKKDTIGAQIVGHWRLVSDINAPFIGIQPLTSLSDEMILSPIHTYEIRRDNKVICTGVYHLDETANPPQPTLHFSDTDNYGWWISFSKDSLILTYAGIILDMAIIRKYVRE